MGTDFQSGHHEIHQGVPTGEEQVPGERTEILEEGSAGGSVGADEPVVLIGEGEKGVIEKGQDVQSGQERSEMLFAVAKVMFQVLALGLKRVVVLVFDLPARPPRGDDRGDVGLGDFEVGNEAVAVKNFSLRVGDGQFTPVGLEAVLCVGQRHRMGITIGVGFPLVAGVLNPQGEGLEILAGWEKVDPVVEGLVRLGFADKNEMETQKEAAPAGGLMGIEVVAEQGGLETRIGGSVLFEPSFGGGDLTVLLGVAVLWGDELRAERDGVGLAGSHEDWS